MTTLAGDLSGAAKARKIPEQQAHDVIGVFVP
jgi:hypothetical protein